MRAPRPSHVRLAGLLLSLGLAAAATTAVPGCARPAPLPLPQEVQPGGGPRSGGTLALELPRYPGGERYALSRDVGNVVLLDVWATWCEPCRESLPFYQSLQQELGARGFKVYALSIDADTRQIGEFLQQTQVTLPILHDVDALFSERYLGIRLMPTTFLIDRKGVIRYVHEGYDPSLAQTYRSEIEALLAEPPSNR